MRCLDNGIFQILLHKAYWLRPRGILLITLGIIGFGNMGEACIKGLTEANIFSTLLVAEKYHQRLTYAMDTYNAVDYTTNISQMVDQADAIILAIKPQDLPELGNILENSPTKPKGKFISLLAGKTISEIQQSLHGEMVIRLMPNLAALVQKALTGIVYGPNCTDEFKAVGLATAKAMGSWLEVPENLMGTVTGLSGSGIAYALQYLHAMALAGTKTGIPYGQSLQAAMDVMEGAIELTRSTRKNPIETITSISSPGGTTIAGIHQLEAKGFTDAIITAVEATVKRSDELSK
jgi:pyrroline-5-carboxylate reductase